MMIVQSFLNKVNPGTEFALKCLRTFTLHDIGVDLYTFDVEKMSNVAKYLCLKGINILDASVIDVTAKSKFLTDRTLSNHFRYKLLLERGGWWTDTDNICIAPMCSEGLTGLLSSYNALNGNVGLLPNINMVYYDNDPILERLFLEVLALDDSAIKVKEYYNGAKFWNAVLPKIRNLLADPILFNPVSLLEYIIFGHVPSLETIERFRYSKTIHLWGSTREIDYNVNDSLLNILTGLLDDGVKITYEVIRRKVETILSY